MEERRHEFSRWRKRLYKTPTAKVAWDANSLIAPIIEPRSGGSAVSPGRKPRVRYEILASRVSGDRVLSGH